MSSGREQHIATMERAIEKREGFIAEHEARLQALRAWKRSFTCGGVEKAIEHEKEGLWAQRAKLLRIREELTRLTVANEVARANEEFIRKRDAKQTAERERFNAQHAPLIASLRANPAEVNARLREAAKAKLAPKRSPLPESRHVLTLTIHAVDRYLERVCGATVEEVETLRRLSEGRRKDLWHALAPVIVPPEILQGIFTCWTNTKERVVCVPGSHYAKIFDHAIVSVMGWPGAEPFIPHCLLPYLDANRKRRLPQHLPAFRVHSPLGLHRAVKVSPAHRCGLPSVQGCGVDVIADNVRAEGGGREAVLRVAEWLSLPWREVQDAVEFEALPAAVRKAWEVIGDYECAEYWAARKETA